MLTFLNTHFSESPEHIRIHKTIFSENRISNGLSNCGLCFNLKVELFLLNVIKAKVNVYVCVWIWICMSMSMCRYMGMDICRCMGVGYVCVCLYLYVSIYIYIPVEYCTNVVRVLDRKTRAKYKKRQINSRFGLAYLLLFSFVSSEIKLPKAVKLQPLLVHIVAHRQAG